jgi:hypothetical protein
MPLEAMGCLIQELLACIATFLRGMAHDSHSVFDSIGNGTCCARSLVSRFGDVVSRSLHCSL